MKTHGFGFEADLSFDFPINKITKDLKFLKKNTSLNKALPYNL